VRNWNNFVIYSGFGQITKYLLSYSSFTSLEKQEYKGQKCSKLDNKKMNNFFEFLKVFCLKKSNTTYFTASEKD
jgi:hypothetical protein